MVEKFTTADFYVTCATVIPVLFVALALQLRPSEFLLGGWSGFLGPNPDPNARLPSWPSVVGTVLLTWAFLGAVVAGGLGEGAAALALYRGSETHGTRLFVLVCTLALVALVAGGPIAGAVAAMFPGRRGQADSDEDEGADNEREKRPPGKGGNGDHLSAS